MLNAGNRSHESRVLIYIDIAVRIRPMARRLVTIPARVLFIVSGITTLVIDFLYVMQRGEDLPVASEWILFVIALTLLGGFSLIVALLPRSWIAKACKTDREDDQIFLAPLKMLGVLAVISYLIAAGAFFAPHTWNLNVQLMLALCPLYVVKMIVDPSPLWIFLVFSPMNAAVYGSLGALLAYARLAFRRRH